MIIGNPKVIIIPLIIALIAFIFIEAAVQTIVNSDSLNPLVNLGIGIGILGFAGVFGRTLEGFQITTVVLVAIIFISLGLLL